MGEPAHPTIAEREATRELAKRIVDSVRDDEAMPLPFTVYKTREVGPAYEPGAVQATMLPLAQEIELLRFERDEAWRIVRSAAHLAKAYIEIVISDLQDDEEQDNDLGQAQVWIDQANERVPR